MFVDLFDVKSFICFSIKENEANLDLVKEISNKIGSLSQQQIDLYFNNNNVVKESISENKYN